MKKLTLAALLAATLFQVPSPFAWAEGYAVDQKVEVEENGKWYPSVILKAENGKYFIHYDGYQSRYDTWVGPDRIKAIAAAPNKGEPNSPATGTVTATYNVNDKVDVEENGKWYPSVILKAENGKYFIHYDGFLAQYDTWVGPDRIKKLGSPTPVTVNTASLGVGSSVRVWHNGNGQFAWMSGQIQEVKDGQYKIWYGGSRYNVKWFGPAEIQGTKEQIDAAEEAKIDVFMRQAFEGFEKAVANAETVVKSGASAKEVRDAISAATAALKNDYGRAGRHPRVKPVLDRYWAFATREVDFLLTEAFGWVTKAEKANDINFARSHDHVLKRAQEVTDEYKAFRAGTDAETERLDKVMADAKRKVEEAAARIKVAYVANAKVPSEKYTGSDKAALKAKLLAAWKKKYPNLPVLKIVASTNWVRDRYWNTSSGRAYWHDHSKLLMDIVAKKDGTIATVYPVAVTFDNGNRSTMEAYVGTSGYGNYVPYDVLLKNVK